MKLTKPDDPTIPWPEGRVYHTTAIINDPLLHQQHTVMIVTGGKGCDDTIVNDSWIYYDKTWQKVYIVQITLPSITCIFNSLTFLSQYLPVTDWLILFQPLLYRHTVCGWWYLAD